MTPVTVSTLGSLVEYARVEISMSRWSCRYSTEQPNRLRRAVIPQFAQWDCDRGQHDRQRQRPQAATDFQNRPGYTAGDEAEDAKERRAGAVSCQREIAGLPSALDERR